MSENKIDKPRVLRRVKGKLQADMRPVVLEYKEKSKSKSKSEEDQDKYSEGLEDIQELEGDVMHIAQRFTKALAKGVDTYEHERQKSAKEKKDGAIEDFLHNSAKATSAYLKEASDIPLDIADSVNKESYRKRLRKSLRSTSKFIRLFRI